MKKNKFKKIKAELIESGLLRHPIITDDKYFIILDGHHRAKAFHDLGFKKIPVMLVKYNDPRIRVVNRRPNIKVTKEKL
ncbi:MAG: ParB N-terminal domain-containing protein [Patescibacteria group bacterium]|jgi:ParB-like chromosome segregation protein Spo0J